MFDIEFFKNCRDIKKKITDHSTRLHPDDIYARFESLRNKNPFVFNVETTNFCNMNCIMCPRPKLMKRRVKHMEMDVFEKIIKSIAPHSDGKLQAFRKFVQDEYGIYPDQKNENAFYFYRVARSLTLHGFGEPVLDPYIVDRVKLCSEHKIPTYFSCVPANIDIKQMTSLMKSGLGAVKFSIDALDDKTQKKIRGPKSDFTGSYKKICELIDIKKNDPRLKTELIVMMVELSSQETDPSLTKDFMRLWEDKPVYAYVKSQDNRWYYDERSDIECKSHYASQYCEFPWTSMTVMSDGSIVPCTQDYNCEMTFGNIKERSLKDIWNSREYDEFRKWHIYGTFPKGHKCAARCDIKTVSRRMDEKNKAYSL